MAPAGLLVVNMNVSDRQDCELSIGKIRDLLNCGIFDRQNAGAILQSAAFTELMICLRDLLHKAEKYAKRISFTTDVIVNKYVQDVTDLVTAVRDACCHIDSFKRLFDDRGSRGAFLVIYGKGCLAKIDELELKSNYDDDTAFFYGSNRIYMNRHIVRAFKEARSLLEPLLVHS